MTDNALNFQRELTDIRFAASHTCSKSTRINEEIHMYAKTTVTSARSLVGATAVVCTLFAFNVAANDKIVTVSVQVNHEGLDLSQPVDARTFYTRLQNAAWLVCTRETRVDLLPVDPPKVCYEKALGAAIRSAKAPTLTQIYLATHTLQEAAAHGVEVPAQLVAK